MALSLRPEGRQTQSLTLTPQLMQSIKLLQLSHLELNQFVEAELLRNPLLERDDQAEVGGPAETVDEADEEPPADYPDTYEDGSSLGSADDIAAGFDAEVGDVFPEQAAEEVTAADGWRDTGSWRQSGAAGSGSDAPDLDKFVSAEPTLTDHLAEQIALIVKNPAERLIARFLIDNLNEAGYLTAEPEAMAIQLGTDAATVEAVIDAVQGCEPLGVFARSVADCMAIQLRERDRLDPMMRALLGHLDLVATHDLEVLARQIGAELEDVRDMVEELKHLDPRPGLAFGAAPVQAVVPDVFVRRGNDGSWQVELNSDVLPRVLVNRSYYATVSRKARGTEEKQFLSDCRQTADWLVKSLDQRAQTILKVAAEIVRRQDGFLERGVAHLKPMTLRAVADEIDMHESTVSRVTANKFVATPRGLFEMKYFFTTALASAQGGEDQSAEAVRHRIRELIADEDEDAILSDDAIAAMINRELGIDIARRTVAKYREAMSIPSSVVRRRKRRVAAIAR